MKKFLIILLYITFLMFANSAGQLDFGAFGSGSEDLEKKGYVNFQGDSATFTGPVRFLSIINVQGISVINDTAINGYFDTLRERTAGAGIYFTHSSKMDTIYPAVGTFPIVGSDTFQIGASSNAIREYWGARANNDFCFFDGTDNWTWKRANNEAASKHTVGYFSAISQMWSPVYSYTSAFALDPENNGPGRMTFGMDAGDTSMHATQTIWVPPVDTFVAGSTPAGAMRWKAADSSWYGHRNSGWVKIGP